MLISLNATEGSIHVKDCNINTLPNGVVLATNNSECRPDVGPRWFIQIKSNTEEWLEITEEQYKACLYLAQ